MMYFDIDVGEQLKIGETEVSLVEKRGRKARLSVQAGREIPVRLVRPESRQPHHKERERR
jgi:sRNA-binding carbon storage regulator CsrA